MKCSRHEHPTAFYRRVWTSISSSGSALCGCRQGLLGGLEEEEGVYSQPPQQFYFSETLRLAFVLHFSFYPLSCSLGSLIITRYIYQSFSAVPARPSFLPPSPPALQPLCWNRQLLQWICWGPGERQGPVTSGGMIVCLA